MIRIRTLLVAVCTLAFLITGQPLLSGAQAQEPIRFARQPDISPDGKLVAFSYLGDIWTVETIGGVARPVTMHQAHDIAPVFSPDGKQIAFSSNRHGGYDVFVVSAHGGKPRRLTFDSAADLVCGWSPDGKNVLFASPRGTDFPPGYDLFSVPVEGGREKRITHARGKEGVFSPGGNMIAYVRGAGTWYRKGYRGSSNDDVWICDADGTNNRQISTFNGQDTSPMWAPDSRALYYVSEIHGTPANIVRHDLTRQQTPQLVTFHKDEAVRRARISANGEWIVYECGPDLYVVSTHEGNTPRKLAIEVHADDKVNPETTYTFVDKGASEYAVSADEEFAVVVVHGDLFLISVNKTAAPIRLTDHPAFDHGVAWAPDSSKIVFTSDRDGYENLYLLEGNDPDHAKFVEAHKFKVTQLTNGPELKQGVTFSPDGKRIAFLRAGKLWSMNPDGTDQKAVVNDTQVIDFEWSPDSKWLTYARLDGSFASELYIIPAAGATPANPARNVTRFATYNAGVTWSGDGKKLCFLSQRRRDQGLGIYTLSLQKEAVAGAPASSDIDWDDIHLRVEEAAPVPSDEAAISYDGKMVAFSSGGDLYVSSAGGGQMNRLTTGGARPTQIQWSKRSSSRDLVYFRDGSGSLRKARAGGGPDLASLLAGKMPPAPGTGSSSTSVVSFKIKMTVRTEEEFNEMFEQSWRSLSDHFYDPKYHGVDWALIRSKYQPLVKQCALKEDLDALISLMMGELNASHMGISRPGQPPEEITADLGLIFEESYKGPGLKVAEVLKRGPADKRGLGFKPGDIVLWVDGEEVTEQTNISKLLNGKVGETVELQVLAPGAADPKDPKGRRRVEVKAVERGPIGDLMYERWVEHNAQRVTELSKGTLGYIHIPSMDEKGLDRFLRSLYSDSFDKEAIILDVRFNGGGFTHDQVLNYLGAREHTFFRQRDGGTGLVLRSYDRKWTRPVVLLINNQSYSDAEIFPNAFRALGLGKLVGQPTGGHVIGTSSLRLIDGSVFRIPRTGVFTTKGVNMEKEGVMPDVLVEQNPDQLAKGLDPQLDKAVEVLQQDVTAWKKTHPNVASIPEEGKPVPAVATPAVAPAPGPKEAPIAPPPPAGIK